MTLPGLSHGVPSEQQNGNTRPVGASQTQYGDKTRSSFDQSQHGIPGLAFGQSDLGSASYTSTPVRNLPQSSFRAPMAGEHYQPTPRDASEEGEISDDEEDLYEPEDLDAQMHPVPATKSPDRERTGSYSPYLSPREVDESQFDSHNLGLGNAESLLDISVSDAKKQAQEAILRLSLLNVQYEDYVNDGIDRAVLNQLFKELGMSYTNNLQQPLATSTVAAPVAQQESTTEISKAKPTETAPPIVQKPKDKAAAVAPTSPKEAAKEPKEPRDAAESRKDRIARLLAARKGKTPPPAPAVSKPAAAPAPTKASLEKSKLLHQKMEALLKSREALQRERAQVANTSEESEKQIDNAAQEILAADTDLSTTQKLIPTAPRAMLTQSNPQVQAPFDRALHQSRSSRLLIDVSDEEGEDEMDIDSDEHGEFSLETPQSGSATESDELNNMKMKIEAMKRRIAEAEARKKARQSIPGSPSSPNLEQLSTSVEMPITSAGVETLASNGHTAAAAAASQSPLTAHDTIPNITELRSLSRDRSVARSSRAASERLSVVEAHRKEQLLKLKALQSQIANIQKDIDDSFLEEQKLQEESMEPEDDDAEEVGEPQGLRDDAQPVAGKDQFVDAPEATDIGALTAALEREQQELEAQNQLVQKPADETAAELQVPDQPPQDDTSETSSDGDESGLPDASGASDEEDVPMEETDVDSNAKSDSPSPQVAAELSSEDVNSESDGDIEIHDGQTRHATEEAQPATTNDDEKSTEAQQPDTTRTLTSPLPTAPRSSFVPYDSPLHYFHSYRFHPDYDQEVSGGLRSLTYSNKIDTAQPICPDELSGRTCPRGTDCEFQHFNTMQAADDQILLQLGAHGSLADSQKQQYVNGLRQLLTDFRDRKIKDFDTISRGIIEYRAQFTDDKSKILPLGNVSI